VWDNYWIGKNILCLKLKITIKLFYFFLICNFDNIRLKSYAGKKLSSHAMPMNFSHINIGIPGTGKKVDQWHLDSVGYVLVVMMSETKDMVGGELQVLTRDRDDNALEILNSQTDSYTPEEIISVNYATAGRGIFMQGSHIFHQVTAVVSGPRPRISLVFILFFFVLQLLLFKPYFETKG